MNGSMPLSTTYLLFVLFFNDSPYAGRICLEESISYRPLNVQNNTPLRRPRLVFKIFMTSHKQTLLQYFQLVEMLDVTVSQ